MLRTPYDRFKGAFKYKTVSCSLGAVCPKEPGAHPLHRRNYPRTAGEGASNQALAGNADRDRDAPDGQAQWPL